jgi:hypothetical protein
MKKNSGGSTSGSVKKQLKKKKSEKEVNSVSSITDIDLSSAVQGQYCFLDEISSRKFSSVPFQKILNMSFNLYSVFFGEAKNLI